MRDITAFKTSSDRWLNQAVRRIAARAKPWKIILFGSRARGSSAADSDIDLLVLFDHPISRPMSYDLVDDAIGRHRWPVDILVRTAEDVRERLRIGDTFFRRILRDGKVLYES